MSGNGQSSISNLQAEKEVLGAILLAEPNFWGVSDILEPACFSTKDHQAIYRAMADLAKEDRAIRTTAVANRVGAFSDGSEPTPYLSALIHLAKQASADGPIPLEEYADDIARSFSKRQIKTLAERMMKEAESPTSDPLAILDSALTDASDLVRATDRVVERSIPQVGDDVKILLQEAVTSQGIGIGTSLITVDEMIGGLFPGDFVLLGGEPGGGKTSLAMQIAMHVSQKEHVGFIELEMENRMLLLRVIAGQTGISVRQMMGGVNDDQFEKISNSIQQLGNHKLSMIASHRMSIAQIEARARSMKRKNKMKLLIIDHLGLIKRPGKYRLQKHEKDFENAEQLMELGKALGVPIICLCHLTKAGRQKDGDPSPTMEDFSGGGMEQHADLMLCTFNRHQWLEKNPPTAAKGAVKQKWDEDIMMSKNRIELYKLKDRKGPMRERVILHWDGKRTRFQDLGSVQTELIKGGGDMPPAFEGFDFGELERPHA